jgi:hypothetical protein
VRGRESPSPAWELWITSLLTGWAVVAAPVLHIALHASGAYSLVPGELATMEARRRQQPGRDSAAQKPVASGFGIFSRLFRNMPVAAGLLIGLAMGVFCTLFHFAFFHIVHGIFLSLLLPLKPESL